MYCAHLFIGSFFGSDLYENRFVVEDALTEREMEKTEDDEVGMRGARFCASKRA
jgi:hypothetical protein